MGSDKGTGRKAFKMKQAVTAQDKNEGRGWGLESLLGELVF